MNKTTIDMLIERQSTLRLLLTLQDEYDLVGENGKLIMELPVSRDDLAAILGVRRESVSRVIHDLNDGGLVRFMGRHLEMPNTPIVEQAGRSLPS